MLGTLIYLDLEDKLKTELLAKLEQAIDRFIEENNEDRNFYIYDTQVKDMANAAAAVYDASEKGQAFAKTA